MRALAVLPLLLAGCGGELVYCTDLAAELAECDVAATELSCELITLGDRVALKNDFDARGCDAVWNEDGEVDDRLCRAFNWDCPEPLQPAPREVPLANPVVFVGGVDNGPEFDWNPDVLDRVARETGVDVYQIALSGWAPREVRALELWQKIRVVATESRTGRVNLICYAVGGLDCRFLVSPGGLFANDAVGIEATSNVIASITTIATPHRGTDVASAALYASDEVLGAVLGQRASSGRTDADVVRSLEELTPEAMVEFNEIVVDAPDVAYYAWAGVTHFLGSSLFVSEASILEHCVDDWDRPSMLRHPDTQDLMSDLLAPAAPFAGRTIDASGATATSPHDGMVSVVSAKWGAFIGCIPADHYDVIGQHHDGGFDPYTGFDTTRFYASWIQQLFERGF